ncbi:MAG: ATP-dependent Lon protease, partial [Trichlorobacter sp.]|uniref:S16 family serine protease n=1 Tax=Trichlorobacter sp. TaxID=2911007 RepID=UPI0025679CF2
KESIDTAYRYLKANSKNVSGTISTSTKDYLMHLQDLNGIGITNQLSLTAFIALCSAALHKPVISSLAVLGNLSISGTIIKVEELANVLQVCLDSGAKKVLLPTTSAADMASVPPELMDKFSLIFYQSPEDAVFKALGVE